MKDEIEYVKISKEDLNKLKLVDGNNKVLLRKLTDNVKQKTKSGIWVAPRPFIQNITEHIDRVFEVVKVPNRLRYVKQERRGIIDMQHKYFWTPPWKAQIEINKGDIVITAKIQIPKSLHLKCEDDVYVLLDYHELYLAFRPGDGEKEILGTKIKEIIPLNGFIVCETIKDFLHSKIIWLPKNPKTDRVKRGKVVYVGMPNLEYPEKEGKKDTDDNINVRPGMIVMKKNDLIHRDLENVMHSVFDRENEYFVIQRKDIIHGE